MKDKYLQTLTVLWSRSRPETDIFAGAGKKEPAPGCCCVTLWWQSCNNSYNLGQILTIFTQIERKNRYGTGTLKKKKLFYFIFKVFLKFFFKFIFSEPDPTARTGAAPQHWTQILTPYFRFHFQYSPCSHLTGKNQQKTSAPCPHAQTSPPPAAAP